MDYLGLYCNDLLLDSIYLITKCGFYTNSFFFGKYFDFILGNSKYYDSSVLSPNVRELWSSSIMIVWSVNFKGFSRVIYYEGVF